VVLRMLRVGRWRGLCAFDREIVERATVEGKREDCP